MSASDRSRDDGDEDRILPRSVDAEVREEFEFHRAMRVRDLIASGMTLDQAEERARGESANLSDVMQECRTIGQRRERRMNRSRLVAEVLQDVRFAARLLVRRRAFAVLAITVIALGVGAATSIFSIVDGVLVRALPFADPGRLMAVWLTQPNLANDPVLSRMASATVLGSREYFAVRDQVPAFESVAIWGEGRALLASDAEFHEVRTVRASASLLDVLRASPAQGRGFLHEENVLNGPDVAMIGWETWQSRFGGAGDMLGRRVVLDDRSYTIVGILPEGLRLDRTEPPADFWIPALQAEYDLPERNNRSFQAIGRLVHGASARDAEAQAARAVTAATGDTMLSVRVENWQADQTREARAPLYMLLGAAGVLLLIGCVNVAMLTLGESAARERELVSRAALGASLGRVLRQLLVESLTIAAIGAAAGAVLAWFMTRALVQLAPAGIPGIDGAAVDWRALLFAACCAAVVGVLAGLAPAISLARDSRASLLRMGQGQSARHARRTQRWLVTAEIAWSVVLLAGAGLLGRSLWQLSQVNPGFRPEQLAVVKIIVPRDFYPDDARRLAYYEQTASRLAQLPGIRTASAGAFVPFALDGTSSSPVGVEGRVYDDRNRPPFTVQRSILPGYFDILGIPMLRGRSFTAADGDGGEPVAIISEAARLRDFPEEDPLGRRVLYQGKLRRIVGVAGDVHASSLTRAPGPAIYVPLAQHMGGTVSFIIRPERGLDGLAPMIRQAVREFDAAVSLASVEPLPSLVAQSYAAERYRTIIVAAFAILATVLAAVGLYGVTLRAVTRRTREIGIRIALGATPRMATRLLMRDTVRGVAVGVVIGLPLALLANRHMSEYLFHVSPGDVGVYVVVVGLLVTIAFVASLLPARKAGRTNPARMLSGD